MFIKNAFRRVLMLATLALLVTAVIPAEAGVFKYYQYGFFRIGYDSGNPNNYALCKRLEAYISPAYLAAYRALGGFQGSVGKGKVKGITILVDETKKSTSGYQGWWHCDHYFGVNLNLNASQSPQKIWGGVLARYLTEGMFYSTMNVPNSWNSKLYKNYGNFIEKSFGLYAQHVLYSYGTKLSSSRIKVNFKYYSKLSGRTLNWVQSAQYLDSKITKLNRHALYQLLAQASFMHRYGAAKVKRFFNNLESYSYNYGPSLRSKSYYTARNYAEDCFFKGFGARANAEWHLKTVYRDKRFLYGKFYYLWYASR